MSGGLTEIYLDVDLVCSDGVITYPKLVAGLVFPSLASCQVLQYPTHHTLLLPDYTSVDLINTVHSLLGLDFDSFLHHNLQDLSPTENVWEEDTDSADVSDYLQMESREDDLESEEDLETSEGSLVCKICYTTFKTRSGWRNHKVIHQKYRTKEYACYICYRRFYWDKDCRRHVKNIHGLDFYDPEESKLAANINRERSDTKVELEQSYGILSKSNLMKMKIQMIKCKKSRLDNSRSKEPVEATPEENKGGISKPLDNLSESNLDLNLNNNVISPLDISSQNNYCLRSEGNEIVTKDTTEFGKQKAAKKNIKDLCHSCQDCAKKFLNLKSLKAHERTCKAPIDSPFECSLCERVFINFDKLQRHWRVNHKRQSLI